MSYFGFLALFLLPPILLFAFALWRERDQRPFAHSLVSPWTVLFGHVLIAVIWTTPWDNYLVATRVWWYDPDLVTGITFGYVPIEEYTFFIVQPIMTGLWLLWLWRRAQSTGMLQASTRFNRICVAVLGLVWLIMLGLFIAKIEPVTYLCLELLWALPPIMLQVGYGADILWQNRRLVAWAIVPTTLYLALADAIAIGAGTWTISPTQSLEWLILGRLPIEEFLFFLLTNTLIVFGMVLALNADSQARLKQLSEKFSR